MLEPLRGNPLGDAVADLLQPDLKVLVNLGYGPDNLPYSEYPDVITPAPGLFPDVNLGTVFDNLATGAQQGIQDFLADLKDISPSSVFASMTSPAADVTPLDLDPSNFVTELQTVLADNGQALATLFAAPLDTFMPLVDVLGAVLYQLPTVTTNLMLAGFDQLASGNTDAAVADFTDPIGGITGLLSIGAFELLSVVEEAVQRVGDALQTAVTEDTAFIEGLPGLF